MIDETTLRLDSREIQILQNNAPYLIAMHVRDLAEIVIDEDIVKDESENVISYLFRTNSHFSKYCIDFRKASKEIK